MVEASYPSLVTLMWKLFSVLTPSFGFSGHMASAGTFSTALPKEVPIFHQGACGKHQQGLVCLMCSPNDCQTHQVGEATDEMSKMCGRVSAPIALLVGALMGPPWVPCPSASLSPVFLWGSLHHIIPNHHSNPCSKSHYSPDLVSSCPTAVRFHIPPFSPHFFKLEENSYFIGIWTLTKTCIHVIIPYTRYRMVLIPLRMASCWPFVVISFPSL